MKDFKARKLRILREYDAAYKEIEAGLLTSIPVLKHGKRSEKLAFVGKHPNWGLTTGKTRKNGELGDLAYRNTIEKLLDNGMVSERAIDECPSKFREIIGGNDTDIVNVLRYLIERVDSSENAVMHHLESDVPDDCYEGHLSQIVVNRYERDKEARDRCVAAHGCYCHICGLDFKNIYGDLGRDFIHVHHLVPLHTIGKEYQVNPETDLIPVCPNCHAMLHRYLHENNLHTREECVAAVDDLARSIELSGVEHIVVKTIVDYMESESEDDDCCPGGDYSITPEMNLGLFSPFEYAILARVFNRICGGSFTNDKNQ